MPMYMFYLRRFGDAPTGLEAFELADDGGAFQAAATLLELHQTCDHVDVWTGDRAVVARHREQPIVRPVVDPGPAAPDYPPAFQLWDTPAPPLAIKPV